jgi:hypothetical protein
MAWDEWERIKAGVAGPRGTGTRLGGPPAETDPGVSAVTGGVRSSRKAWLAAGEGVGSLSGGVATALGKLTAAQPGPARPDDCLSAVAQRELHASWQRYAQGVSRRCASLQGILRRVGREQLTTDEGVRAELSGVRVRYADTDPVSCLPTAR